MDEFNKYGRQSLEEDKKTLKSLKELQRSSLREFRALNPHRVSPNEYKLKLSENDKKVFDATLNPHKNNRSASNNGATVVNLKNIPKIFNPKNWQWD